jgi:glycosyltransferase involved in cell wall biosynthesis
MLRIAHFTRFMGTGGLEQVIQDLCRFRDDSRYACLVASQATGEAADGMRAAGARLYTGPNAFREAARDADLINFHVCELQYAEQILSVVPRLGKPWVATLHDRVLFPDLPAVAVCTSHNVRALQAPQTRCVTIPNGVDTRRFRPRARPAREEVVITRICRPPKCAPYFWEVVGRVLEAYPQVRFRIVGNPAPCEHPSGRVEFLGVRRDVEAVLADTDIFFYTPYRNVGSMDLVTLEASASAVPCVVSDVSCVREGVRPGRNGILTPFGDVEAAVAALERLILDAELRQRMGDEGARMAREQYEIRRVAQSYEAVYEGILSAYAEARRRPA